MNALQIILIFFAVFTVSTVSASPIPCIGSDLKTAQLAQHDAKGTLNSAINFLRGNDAKTQQLLKRWFGRNDQTTNHHVTSVLKTTSDWINGLALYCIYQNDGALVEKLSAPNGSIILQDTAGQLYAYVDPFDLTKIYLGLKFFKAPSTGRNSQLGTIVHEVTHFFITGNTNDIEYGKDDSLRLAAQHPDSALKNADNYEYFIEEWLGL